MKELMCVMCGCLVTETDIGEWKCSNCGITYDIVDIKDCEGQ